MDIMKSKYNFLLIVLAGMWMTQMQAAENVDQDPAEIAIGERLFLETRFAQAWYAHPGKGDPVLDYTSTMKGNLDGPYAGKTMNCRTCHMVDEHASTGMRTYADFTHHSPVPQREDGRRLTARNSMSLVNISIPRENDTVFHFDGEFNSMEDLVVATLTDRNYGWLPKERNIALKHIAGIIRNDDGKGELAREFGGSYRKILSGTDADIPEEFRLPETYRADVATASDREILDAIAKLIAAYVTDLAFSRNEQGQYNTSPYDQFLHKNGLPGEPAAGETTTGYNKRLANAIGRLRSPQYIDAAEGKFASHTQAFVFGEKEFAGMKLFFARGNGQQRGGNCIACHQAPHFSDFGFHNTGVTQAGFDAVHGQGEFRKLAIPDLVVRNTNYAEYLPATIKHPDASGRFRSISRKDTPGSADLGLWNVFSNPDMPNPQTKLKNIICRQAKQSSETDCSDAALLPLTIASFKTPVLRDLGHSEPYMHTGEQVKLEDVLTFYLSTSTLARNGQLRNPDPELQHIYLSSEDIDPLVAFLKALNEDYE